jgi:hypothetical protein
MLRSTMMPSGGDRIVGRAPHAMRISVYECGADVPEEACLAIAQALPDYFTAGAVRQMRRDLAAYPVYVIAELSVRPACAMVLVCAPDAGRTTQNSQTHAQDIVPRCAGVRC